MMKDELKGDPFSIPYGTPQCPSEGLLWSYLNGALQKEREEKIGDHVVRCRYCLESLLLAQEVRPGIEFGPSEGPPGEILEKLLALSRKKAKPWFQKEIWLILSLFSIILSFFIPRYFIQCLTIGILFGAKWIFDTATKRTLIVMYETLKKKGDREETLKEREEKKAR